MKSNSEIANIIETNVFKACIFFQVLFTVKRRTFEIVVEKIEGITLQFEFKTGFTAKYNCNRCVEKVEQFKLCFEYTINVLTIP